MAIPTQHAGRGRWHLTLRPGHGAADARTPYRANTPHTGRIVVGNPWGAPVLAAGVDLLDVRRFELAAHRCGDWLERRLLSAGERSALAADPVLRLHQLGCSFGVKESVLKALGGIPHGGRYPHIEVEPHRPGLAGEVRLSGALAGRATERGARLLAGALPIRDGLVLSWALALGRPTRGNTTRDTIRREEAA